MSYKDKIFGDIYVEKGKSPTETNWNQLNQLKLLMLILTSSLILVYWHVLISKKVSIEKEKMFQVFY